MNLPARGTGGEPEREGPAGPGPAWQRLHPLTPVVGAVRSLAVLALVLLEDSRSHSGGAGPVLIVVGGLAFLLLLTGLVRFAVTRWALDGPTLRIETGLLRRDARQLPLARIQAVDVVRPFVARAFGLAELRVRLAGSGRANGRLAYLTEPAALDLRARLLAGHHGLDQSTPEPVEQPLATVPPARLIVAALLSPAAGITLVLAGALVALTTVSQAAAAAIGGTLFVYVISFAHRTWRRVADQYGFAVALAPDGLRLRRGLLSTVAETVPFARVQAVRKVEPLAWRPMGWCRVEVDVAGSPGREQGTRSSRLTRALLPVGPVATADWLLSSALGLRQFELAKPPRRAVWKSPLSYHFLGSASESGVVAASRGRVRKTTTWMPLEKVQSIRWVEGPLQRALHLATVRVDAAGRGVVADMRDRDSGEANDLFESLVAASRSARRHGPTPAVPRGAMSTAVPSSNAAPHPAPPQAPGEAELGGPALGQPDAPRL